MVEFSYQGFLDNWRNAASRKALENPGLLTGFTQLWKTPVSGTNIAAGSLTKSIGGALADINDAAASIAFDDYADDQEAEYATYSARRRWSDWMRDYSDAEAKILFDKADEMYSGSQGTATQVVRGFAEMVPRAVAGHMAAGPIGAFFALGKPEGDRTELQLKDAGVDANTVEQAGDLTTLSMGAMSLMPAARFVKPMLADFALSVGGNVALGAGQREIIHQTLAEKYPHLAAQYDWNDPTAMTLDGLLGAGFFGLARVGGRPALDAPAKADMVDDALVVKADLQAKDTGEVAPVAAADKQAARRNKAAGIEAILGDKPMPEPEPVNAVERPEIVAERTAVADSVAEAIRTGAIIADGESGKKLNELFPSRYPKAN